jgi:hypothetical protein
MIPVPSNTRVWLTAALAETGSHPSDTTLLTGPAGTVWLNPENEISGQLV